MPTQLIALIGYHGGATNIDSSPEAYKSKETKMFSLRVWFEFLGKRKNQSFLCMILSSACYAGVTY